MSRVQRLARGLAAGYVALAANVLYTLASVPLVLHYLGPAEFGLWALVTQVASYLALFDLGMSGSVYRILIDHKDTRGEGTYGAVLQTAMLVFTAQGILIAGAGVAAGFWLADTLDVPAGLVEEFRLLIAGQSAFLALGFATKALGLPLQAHQRLDVMNLLQIGHFALLFLVLWLGLAAGWGLYAMLAASAAGTVYNSASAAIASWVLGLLPRAGEWGRPAWPLFVQVAKFGGDLFLLTIGWQLLSASQLIVISRTLGLEAAAVWAVCTRAFTLAQQFVWRIFDFSGPALTEMFVRGEESKLRERFRDVLVLSASAAVLAAGLGAACNAPFVSIWTAGKIRWDALNDWLMAALLVVTTVTRCLTMWVGINKEIRGLRYVYFAQGLCFVIAAWFAVKVWALPGILIAALAADILWSGIYGLHRTREFFRATTGEILGDWLAAPWRFLAVGAAVTALIWWASRGLPDLPRLLVNAGASGAALALGFWLFGLTPALRAELSGRLRGLFSRG